MQLHRGSLLGILALTTAFMAACSEPVSTAQNPPPFRLSELKFIQGTSFSVDVESDVTLFDKKGNPTRKYKHSATVEAHIVGGLAVGKAKRSSIHDAAFRTMQFPIGSDVVPIDSDVVPDSINLTPVVGVANGDLNGSSSDFITDSNNNSIYIVATSPSENYPVTEVNGYLNGELVATTEMSWTPVSGGYILSEQTETERAGGSVVSVIHSTVEQSTVQFVSEPGMSSRFAAALSSSAQKAVCLLLPTPAYATSRVRCFWEGFDLGASIVGIGFGSAAGGFVSPVAIGVYLLGWGVYTRSLYVYLKCLRPK